MAAREFDVVVFGATGVTGRRVAAYLSTRAGESGVRWAAAGRDAPKIANVLAAAGVAAPETIVADLEEPPSLQAMASRTRVVLDLVGPYALFGRPVIAACIAGGAHYVDITGEMQFVRRTIDEFGSAAEAAAVKIVQTCGFESLPADLAVALAREHAREQWSEELTDVELLATATPPPGRPRASDTISGGTLQSVVAALNDADAATVLDPAALIPDPREADEVRRRSPISLAPWRRGAGVVTPMLPVAYITPAVIQRSAMLAGGARFEPFRYREGVRLDGGPVSLPLRFGIAGVLAGVQASIRAGMRSSPQARQRLARGLKATLPGSGFGPRADRLEGWRWGMDVAARTAAGREVSVRVDGAGHPGYLATARMLGEAGILLAQDGATPEARGCLTPAAALGSTTPRRRGSRRPGSTSPFVRSFLPAAGR